MRKIAQEAKSRFQLLSIPMGSMARPCTFVSMPCVSRNQIATPIADWQHNDLAKRMQQTFDELASERSIVIAQGLMNE